MSIRPLNDRVVLKRDPDEVRTKGGIVIPEKAAEKPSTGVVIAVGPGEVQKDGTRRPVDIQVGDKVLFGRYSGTEIKVEGEDWVVLRESDIMGVFVA